MSGANACGVLMHSALADTKERKPVRLTVITFWTRKKFNGTNALTSRGKEGHQALGERDADFKLAEGEVAVGPPLGKQKEYPPLSLAVIYSRERGRPKGRMSICRKLLTELPVDVSESAFEDLHWFSQRVLKSGCKAEGAKLHAV